MKKEPSTESIPESKITAFHGIFEDKLDKLVKNIKKLRKDPSSKQKVREMILEAKLLKRLIKKDKKHKKETHVHQLQIALRIVDGQIGIDESFPSDRIKMLDISFRDGVLTVDFDIKPL